MAARRVPGRRRRHARAGPDVGSRCGDRRDRLSGPTVRAYDPSTQPLEMVVEQEPLPDSSAAAWRRAALHGLQFLRMLAAPLRVRYRASIVDRYGLTMPAEVDADHPLDRAFQLVTAERLPDGFSMAADWTRWLEQRQPAPTFVDTADIAAIRGRRRAAGSHGRRRYSRSRPMPRAPGRRRVSAMPCQCPARILRPATARLALDAADYRGGRLDWYSFDAGHASRLRAAARAEAARAAHAFLPATMAFRGMPAARWWEFEDGTVALGNTDVAPEDLARLLLLEFAFCYANDYFVVPLQLMPGSLCRIEELTAVNTFGDVIAVDAASPVGAGREAVAHVRDQRRGRRSAGRLLPAARAGADRRRRASSKKCFSPATRWRTSCGRSSGSSRARPATRCRCRSARAGDEEPSTRQPVGGPLDLHPGVARARRLAAVRTGPAAARERRA